MQPIFFESHSHTPLCKHADGWPTEYAAVAYRRGLKGYTVTCHNPMPDGFSASVRMELDEFDQYLNLVETAAVEWKGRVDVRLGLEADFFEGYESFLEQQLTSADFQYVLGSVHPQIAEFRERFWTGDPFEFQQSYFEQLARSAESGLFDCLAHPDLVKNETKNDWQLDRIMDSVCAALDRIAKTGVAMELNTSGLRKRISEMNPFPEMLTEMRQRDIPVVVGADAHVPTRVAADFEDALQLLKQCGYENVSYFAQRERHELVIDDVLASLKSM